MRSFIINLAGIPLRLTCFFAQTEAFCADYLCRETPQVEILITQADIRRERELSAAADTAAGFAVRQFADAYLEILALYRKIARSLLPFGVLLFHACAVGLQGKAYLFTAKSGTGKTTHSRLWLQHIAGSYIINGDKPLLRFTEGGIDVCGTPWQGKEHYGTNAILPLQALCLLERDNTNHIEPLTLSQALPVLIQQSFRPEEKEEMEQVLALIERFNTVPLYRLGCNMEPEAALVACEGMGAGTQ